ncbi:MAG: hypothetical protein BJ554DRAFT_5842, partial [Olpidium bornovanus]
MSDPNRPPDPWAATISENDRSADGQPRRPYHRQDSDYFIHRNDEQGHLVVSMDGQPGSSGTNVPEKAAAAAAAPAQPPQYANDDDEEIDEPKKSPQRRKWVCCTWFLTWWIPTPCLRCCGMTRKDVQMAWREKVALCIIIFFMCLVVIFFIGLFSPIVCPRQYVFSAEELLSKGQGWLAVRGEVFHLKNWLHGKTVSPDDIWTDAYTGKEVGNDLFPVPVSAMCDGLGGPGSIDPSLVLVSNDNTTFDRSSAFHDFRFHPGNYRPYWYWQSMQYLRYHYFAGHTAVSPQLVDTLRQSKGRAISIIDQDVYDVTPYFLGIRKFMFPPGYTPQGSTDFLPTGLISLFRGGGSDITSQFLA